MKIPTDDIDTRILDLTQAEFPLYPAPFELIGKMLSIDEDDVLARIARMKSGGIIRQISAIFDSAALGYHSALIAFKVSDELLDRVAAGVSMHDSVSHCYSRDSDYNLWFTLTVPPECDLHAELATLTSLDGVMSHMLLPNVKVFKIGVILKMSGGEQGAVSRKQTPDSSGGECRCVSAIPINMENQDFKTAVRALQTDLPLVSRPFACLADAFDIPEDKLLNVAHRLLQNSVMRRYGAVLNHRMAGYTFNAMVCWFVSPDMIDEVGIRFSKHPSVSHCYQRPTYPDWPYSIYTMIHARSQEELDRIVADLVTISTNADHLVLTTLNEYKKQRVIYFP
ncbi:Lrp/AsnC family transcriptional regulator [bacterium]|nr:Lrp/AsnC family transcriptional regulator [bacterium]